MPEGIFIPAAIGEPLKLLNFDRLEKLQEAVSGYIETLGLPTPPETSAVLVINEEGKLDDYELNQRATLLLWMNIRFDEHHVWCG